MTVKIHHNTVKKAKTNGISLTVVDGEIRATNASGRLLASGLSGSIVLDQALRYLEMIPQDKLDAINAEDESDADSDDEAAAADAEQVEDDEDGDKPEGLVKRKYKERYKPFKMTCGDDLAGQIRAHVGVMVDGIYSIDRDKLVRFAKANGCWDPRYSTMNNGMTRMNVGNRLRAKVKHGHAVIW